jgi:hypothetical protein
LNELPFDFFYEILDHPGLNISSEDRLFEIILSRSRNDASFWNLLEFVQFEFLSTVSLRLLSSSNSEFVSSLNSRIWDRIWSRLILRVFPFGIVDRSVLRSSSGVHPYEEVRVLHVCSSLKPPMCVDLHFLQDLHSEMPPGSYFFRVTVMECTEFAAATKASPHLLQSFDILMIGGMDGLSTSAGITAEVVESSIAPYWKGGGSVLFLHDSIVRERRWGPFTAHLQLQSIRAAGGLGTTAQFAQDSTLRHFPFALPESVEVAQTHCSQMLPNEFQLIRIPTGDDAFYFGCNGRVGICQLGHEQQIKEDEKKLLANIIVHLITRPIVNNSA